MNEIVPLQGIRACVFDAYGTLFDFGSAAAACRDALGERTVALTELWRAKQLEYTWLRALAGHYADFEQVTRDALDFALDALGIAVPGLRERLHDLYRTLDAYPEVPEVLRSLRERGFVTAILSNGTPGMLRDAMASAGIGGLFDAVLSVDEVATYKPDPRVYRLAVDRLGVAPDAVSFQSSNSWDAHGAALFGMRVVWCNRKGQPRDRLPGVPDREVRSLTELPALLERA
jgi:2-haloacid dehalogenase